MFIGLQRYQQNYNSPYKLCFGPKSFLVVSDPVQARHILKDANTNYDKGVLAEILEPIMVCTIVEDQQDGRYFISHSAVFWTGPHISFLLLFTQLRIGERIDPS